MLTSSAGALYAVMYTEMTAFAGATEATGVGVFATGTFGTTLLPQVFGSLGFADSLAGVHVILQDDVAQSFQRFDEAHARVLQLADERSRQFKGSLLTLGWDVSGYLTVEVEKNLALMRLDEEEAGFSRWLLRHYDRVCGAEEAKLLPASIEFDGSASKLVFGQDHGVALVGRKSNDGLAAQ